LTQTIGDSASSNTGTQENTQGKIVAFLLERKRNFKSLSTLENNGRVLRILAKHANLFEPNQVKEYVASRDVKDGTKLNWIQVYAKFAEYYKIPFETPHITVEDTLPFIPYQKELEAILEASSKRPAQHTLFQLLYETGMRKGEAQRLMLWR
jgi:integrase